MLKISMVNKNLSKKGVSKGMRKEKKKGRAYYVSSTNLASCNNGGITLYFISKLDNSRGKGRVVFDSLDSLRSITDHSTFEQRIRILRKKCSLETSRE